MGPGRLRRDRRLAARPPAGRHGGAVGRRRGAAAEVLDGRPGAQPLGCGDALGGRQTRRDAAQPRRGDHRLPAHPPLRLRRRGRGGGRLRDGGTARARPGVRRLGHALERRPPTLE
ncbi:Adenosylhomocysteinase [Actinacidiphila bryophytorum]|uniref:Adenosylhomocysteinase n=1 Tax=Actinacidiphila bryophytorum TaxID=1436133 RepID=A0A9W4GYK3_9ACTN|nr:Adenosylhomocysteinase [Actinacidiphila bryophytorum]